MSAPTLVQKLSNVKHMPVLLAATSATKEPADGFLVKDIIKMSYESPQTRIFLQQYLVNQLITTNNVYSKLKVLRLFIDLLEEGHIEFKQNLRKTPEPFNEAIKLRPHVQNDSKILSECGRIRDMANKVLDLLYMDVPELRRPTPMTRDSMSSSDHHDTSTRITGFGNSDSSRSSSSTTDRLKSLFGSSGKSDALVYDPSYATMDPVPHNVSSQSTFSVNVPVRSSAAGGSTPVGARHERGHAGGGWGEDNRKSTSNQWSTRGGGGGGGMGGGGGGMGGGGGGIGGEDIGQGSSSSYENSGIEQEQMLVDKILAPGGVRVAPPKEELNKFISRCKVLDCQSVVECLRLKLAAEETNTVLRALFIMESLLRSDVPDVVSHFDVALQDLTDLTSSPNFSIKAKANKILMLLASASAQRPASGKREATQQLTSSGDDEQGEEPEDDEEPEETQLSQTQGVVSIFSGLSVSGEKSQRPKQQNRKKTPKKTTPTTSRKSTQPSASPASRPKTVEQKNGFEDILGLGDLSESSATASHQTVGQVTLQSSQQQEPPLLQALQEGLVQSQVSPEDDSLLTFEEDLEFDPLKRSDSIHRSNSLDHRTTASTSSSNYTTQPALLDHQGQPLPAAVAPTTIKNSSSGTEVMTPMTTSAGSSTSQIGDLAGISLDFSAKGAKPLQKRQESLGELYQMAQASSTQTKPPGVNVIPTPVSMAYPQGMMPMVSGAPPGMPMVSGAPPGMPMVSGAPPGMPMALGVQGGVVYGAGVMPVVYAQAGHQGLMYQPQFGGMSRPVQIAATSKGHAPTEDTGFTFIGKSNKSNAFDFVQDEMKASGTKN